jgi:hypothetical protein
MRFPPFAAGAALIVSGVLMIVAERPRAAAESLLTEAAPG